MKMVSLNQAISALVIGGFATGTALFGAGPAAADPLSDLGPLLGSTCSFAQVDLALHKVSPDTAARLDATPSQKNLLRQAYNQPPAQRTAAFQQLISQHPELATGAGMSPDFGVKLRQVVDTCHSY